MKKILLATTMLIGTAGFAAAEVSVSGDARMGITKADTAGAKAQFNSRARVAFSMSGETDGGLAFGASLRADNSGPASNGSAGSVFISGAFGKLAMGDVDSAGEAAVGQVSGVGYVGVGDLNEISYIGAGAAANDPVVLYSYSMDALTVYLSANDATVAAQKSTGIGLAYSAETFGVSVGYEDGGADTKTYVGLSGSFGAVSAKVVFADQSSTVAANDGQEFAVSATYKADALSLTAFYNSDDRPAISVDSYGVGASYDLGGGASVAAGLARDDVAGTGTAYDLGINFSF
jgi:outer membrane protein OmpU